MAKLVAWDKENETGIIKRGKKLYCIVLNPQTQVRVDKKVRAGNWRLLEKLDRTVWCLAKKDIYQLTTLSTQGVFKPRVLLVMGYGIGPLPSSRRRIGKLNGLMGWYKSEVEDWSIPGRVLHQGLSFDLALNKNEAILCGTQGDASKIKRRKTYHFDGALSGVTTKVYRSGKFIDKPLTKIASHLLTDAPVIQLSRVVVPHKSFEKYYRFMFPESFEK